MRSVLLVITVLGGALAQGNVAVNAGPIVGSTVPSAPIGHLQPPRPAVFSALSGTGSSSNYLKLDASERSERRHNGLVHGEYKR